MPAKTKQTSFDASPPAPMITGKWLIIGVVLVALVGSAGSWAIHYYAAHLSTAFWGPETALLIRDAPHVTLYKKPTVSVDTLGTDLHDLAATNAALQKHIRDAGIDISNAKGLVNLRYAFLDDGNFDWPDFDGHRTNPGDDIGYWWLRFSDPSNSKTATIWFTEDCRRALRITPESNGDSHGTPISTEPMAAGIHDMFSDLCANAATSPESERQSAAKPTNQDGPATAR